MKGKVKVFRFNPKVDKDPYYLTYNFSFKKGMTVLDVLLQIYTEQDSSLGFKYSCRSGHCGLCGVKVNGKEALMCREAAIAEMTISPLANISVVKDLIIYRDEYEKRLLKLRLFLERLDEPQKIPELIDMEAFRKFKIASRCVECFCCLSACPVFSNNPHNFIGPAAFIQEARHLFDPRDVLNRKVIVSEQGLSLCKECGKCSSVCPQHVSPADIIKEMKKTLKVV